MLVPELTVPIWSAVGALVTAAVAADSDFRMRRIRNRLTFPALLAALAIHAVTGGPSGLSQAALGALVAGGILVPGWVMGWMGAGDVKLMAAIGAWLAWPASLAATLASLIAGGAIALIVAARHRALGKSLRGAAVLAFWTAAATRAGAAPPPASGLRFPFAGAILAGSIAAFWIRL